LEQKVIAIPVVGKAVRTQSKRLKGDTQQRDVSDGIARLDFALARRADADIWNVCVETNVFRHQISDFTWPAYDFIESVNKGNGFFV
jgi:predicted amidohydrolase